MSSKSDSVLIDFKKFINLNSNKKYIFDGPTIIYCKKKVETNRIADELKSIGIKASPYHAGMKMEERKRCQTNFINDEIDVRKKIVTVITCETMRAARGDPL